MRIPKISAALFFSLLLSFHAKAGDDRPVLEIQVLASTGTYSVSISSRAEDRILSISCIADCKKAIQYEEDFYYYPLSFVRINDSKDYFCLISSSGSGQNLSCYKISDSVSKCASSGFSYAEFISEKKLGAVTSGHRTRIDLSKCDA